ncbi:uncharacterized protein LOC124492100 [Dermatophagoides farinae]|uniref:uncharacterized protein LOC124492100 n=1 Tax=Dermatophagoides farinae TaxID=6954 RepID=UPI003F5FACCA
MSVINNKQAIIQYEKSLNSLHRLMNDRCFQAECELLKRMSPKISIRLRNSIYSRSITQLVRLIDKFSEQIKHFPIECTDQNNVHVKHSDNVVDKIEQFGFCLYKICIVSMKVFRLSKIWIELGQLVNHFLIINALASRVCIFIKAFMVYTYDIYGHFNDDNKNDKLKKLLKKMNVTPMPATKSAIDSDKREETKNDDLGVQMDRKLYQSSLTQLQSNDNKTKARNKKKNKQNFVEHDNSNKGQNSVMKIRRKKSKKLSMANKFTVTSQQIDH